MLSSEKRNLLITDDTKLVVLVTKTYNKTNEEEVIKFWINFTEGKR